MYEIKNRPRVREDSRLNMPGLNPSTISPEMQTAIERGKAALRSVQPATGKKLGVVLKGAGRSPIDHDRD